MYVIVYLMVTNYTETEMKKFTFLLLITFCFISCKKEVEKPKNRFFGIYKACDGSKFCNAFDNTQDIFGCYRSTLILQEDSTYIFDTDKILSKGYWTLLDKDSIKFTCQFKVEKFEGIDYNPKITACKTDIPILIFQNDTILYEQKNKSIGIYFEFAVKQ